MSETTQTPFDDELPSPPANSEAASAAVVVDGTIDGDLLAKVPELGEAIEKGTYHFRLDRYSEGWNDPDPKNPEELLFGKQPYFSLFWVCQEEPHTGQQFMDFVSWANKDTFAAASSGNRTALNIVRTRLSRAKNILMAAEYPTGGSFDIKKFFSEHPEVKIQLGIREKKEKINGELKGTGQMVNNAIKYLSLRAPR